MRSRRSRRASRSVLPDKDDLLEAGSEAVDPVAVVVDILDGKVIE